MLETKKPKGPNPDIQKVPAYRPNPDDPRGKPGKGKMPSPVIPNEKGENKPGGWSPWDPQKEIPEAG